MKQYILAFVLVWFIGCGGGGSSTTTNQEVETLSDNSYAVPSSQEEPNLQFSDIEGAYTMANSYVTYDNGKVVEINSNELQNSRMFIYYDNDHELVYQSVYFDGELIGKDTCVITHIIGNSVYLKCANSGNTILDMFYYENGTLLVDNRGNSGYREKDTWVKDDLLYASFLDDIERRKKQVASEMAMLNKIAGKTMVLNFHLSSDYRVEITLFNEPAPVDIYDSTIQATLGGYTDNDEEVVCINFGGLADNPVRDYDYACTWSDNYNNNNWILFNIDNQGNITGGYEFALSTQNGLSDAVEEFDALLIDSYIY